MPITTYIIRRATRAFAWRAACVIAAGIWSVLGYILTTL
jgi:hypothetical protein